MTRKLELQKQPSLIATIMFKDTSKIRGKISQTKHELFAVENTSFLGIKMNTSKNGASTYVEAYRKKFSS